VLVVLYSVDTAIPTGLSVELSCVCEELNSIIEPERVGIGTTVTGALGVLEDDKNVADDLVTLSGDSGMEADLDTDDIGTIDDLEVDDLKVNEDEERTMDDFDAEEETTRGRAPTG
jgi:hypothetical protein